MFCQICGARIPEGRTSCVQCGAAAGRVAGLTPPARNLSLEVRSCPRCGYQGASQSYFSGGTHLLALMAGAVMFMPAAFIYFALRYNHRVCPSCGLSWGKHGALALPTPGGDAARTELPGDVIAMGEGSGKRFMSWLFFIFAAMMLTIGLAEGEAAVLGFGLMSAAGGYLLRRSGNEDRLRRRDAILQSLQRPVVQLAAQRGGTLTVTEVAAEFGWSLPRAEKVLQSLEDGYRVMGDVTAEGVIVYNFLELVPVSGPLPRAATLPPPAPEPLAQRPREELRIPVERPAPGGPSAFQGERPLG